MQIEVSIPRPGMLLFAAFGVAGWMMALGGGDGQTTAATVIQQPAPAAETVVQRPLPAETEHVHADDEELPSGGDDTPAAVRYSEAEQRARFAREEQAVLRAKQDILKYQLDALQQERIAMGDDVDDALEEEFRRSTRLFIELMQDETRAEQFLETAMNQMWEASERARKLTEESTSNGAVALEWPVEPDLGISAYYLDAGYEQRFKMKHYAVDIPVDQGSEVFAAAGGIVTNVVDHGLGFNYVTIQHPGGYSTLYGHLSKFAVQKGQKIYTGDLVGYSGGRPGTPGSGFSTGPHLHFAAYRNGAPVDPIRYLPVRAGVDAEGGAQD